MKLDAALGLLAVFLAWCAHAEAAEQPHILILMADNWAWAHAGAYGDKVVQTPVFDSLAREGVLFRHAFCSVPSCAPARAVFLTGQAAHRLEGGANLHGVLPARFPVFTDLLETAGYQVGFSGKGWGPGSFQESGRKRNPAGDRFPSFEAFLQQRDADRPFCYWHSSREPHAPWTVGEEFRANLPLNQIRVPGHLPDHPVVREDIRNYYAEVQSFDAECGAILQRLRAAKLEDNTLVMIVGDNGWQLPRGLAHVYDWGTRVPLAIRWPGVTKSGLVAEEFVCFEDIAPSLLELAGLSPHPEMTGKSFLPLLKGVSEPNRDRVFLERERHANVRRGDLTYPCRAMRTKGFLYVWNLHPERWPSGDPQAYWAVGAYGDVDWSPTKDLLTNSDRAAELDQFFELGFGLRPAEELYDLRDDPDQTRSVHADPRYAATLESMRGEVKDWMQRTGDPRTLGETDLFDRAPYFGGKAKPR